MHVRYDVENKTFSVFRNEKFEGPTDNIFQSLVVSAYPFVYEEFERADGDGTLQCQALRFNIENDHLEADGRYKEAIELATKISHGSFVMCGIEAPRLILCDVIDPTCSTSVYATNIPLSAQ